MSIRETGDVNWSKKANAIGDLLLFKINYTVVIFIFGIITAVLEGIGLSFILPIVRVAERAQDPATEAEGLMRAFVAVYEFLGVPFTLEFVILGVAGVMTVRYTLGFMSIWLRARLRQEYVRHLQSESYRRALDAEVAYFDSEGTDYILNAIVTQSVKAGQVISQGVKLIEKAFLAGVFVIIAIYLAPVLTLFAAIILGTVLSIFRYTVESGYSVGDQVAEANERIQKSVQAGTQGIRDVKIYQKSDDLYDEFMNSLNNYVDANVKVRRNQGGLNQFYQLAAAIVMFLIIYLSITVVALSLAELGLFLFLMFRLAPILSTINERFYSIEGNLPHLIRTQDFLDELAEHQETNDPVSPVPDRIEHIEFDDISFSYKQEVVLEELTFSVSQGEFIAFVGESGAGKSTIASLLARMYEPDEGEVRVNGTPIREFDIDEWRSKIAYVRQDSFIFNDTLRYNVTLANRDATESELERACSAARVDEFLDELPNGYDTVLGDDGVQLSGGQRQRVAIARALIKDAEILLLDEATSDLDSNLEEEIQNAIESMSEEYTTVAIAHRLSTVMNADRIYTVRDGKITETGTHQELLKRSGKYAELYTTQIQSG